jgi:hypothetical protein
MNLINILNHYNLNNTNTLHGTDKNTGHSYIENFYEKAFEEYKDKEINLLEIGIACGASLFLWKKFFSNGNFYGLDIHNVLKEEYKFDGANYMMENAYDLNTLRKLPNFDIIIDDGPHDLESQVFALQNYSDKLIKGGILVIEDIQNEDNLKILIDKIPNKYKMNYRVFDLRKIKNRHDDIILTIKNV